jgi:hypothetical protein
MLVVESDEPITEKLCLFYEQHGEGERDYSGTSVHEQIFRAKSLG